VAEYPQPVDFEALDDFDKLITALLNQSIKTPVATYAKWFGLKQHI